MNLANALKKPCKQCGIKTVYKCRKCADPLCKRCQTRKPRGFQNTAVFLPKGVCKSCVIKWENEIKENAIKKIFEKIS